MTSPKWFDKDKLLNEQIDDMIQHAEYLVGYLRLALDFSNKNDYPACSAILLEAETKSNELAQVIKKLTK